MPCPAEFIGFAHRLADAARALALRHFRAAIDIETKSDFSPVTAADRAIETMLRDMISAQYPGHGVVGEEFAGRPATGAHRWVLDPIDGTKAFITGKPTFGTLIALLDGARAILGIIEHPALGERWVGAAGQATTHNGDTVRTRPRGALDRAILHASSPDMFQGPDAPAFQDLAGSCKHALFGGDCYQYGVLASGYVDLVVEASLKPFDYMALAPVIEGAGGLVTDWAGQPLGLESDGRVLAAASPDLHAAARRHLGQAL